MGLDESSTKQRPAQRYVDYVVESLGSVTKLSAATAKLNQFAQALKEKQGFGWSRQQLEGLGSELKSLGEIIAGLRRQVGAQMARLEALRGRREGRR